MKQIFLSLQGKELPSNDWFQLSEIQSNLSQSKPFLVKKSPFSIVLFHHQDASKFSQGILEHLLRFKSLKMSFRNLDFRSQINLEFLSSWLITCPTGLQFYSQPSCWSKSNKGATPWQKGIQSEMMFPSLLCKSFA